MFSKVIPFTNWMLRKKVGILEAISGLTYEKNLSRKLEQLMTMHVKCCLYYCNLCHLMHLCAKNIFSFKIYKWKRCQATMNLHLLEYIYGKQVRNDLKISSTPSIILNQLELVFVRYFQCKKCIFQKNFILWIDFNLYLLFTVLWI